MVHPKKSANRGHVGWGYSFLDGSVMAPTPFVISPPTNGGCQSLLAAYWDCNPSVVWCIISSKRTHLQWEEWCCDVLWYCLWHPLQWVSSHLLTFVHNFLGTLWGAAPSLLPIMAAIPPPRETPVSTISKPSSLLFACNQMAWYPCGISWPTKNEANSILARSIPPQKKKTPQKPLQRLWNQPHPPQHPPCISIPGGKIIPPFNKPEFPQPSVSWSDPRRVAMVLASPAAAAHPATAPGGWSCSGWHHRRVRPNAPGWRTRQGPKCPYGEMVGEMAENLEVWKLGMAFHIYIIIYNIYIMNIRVCVYIYMARSRCQMINNIDKYG